MNIDSMPTATRVTYGKEKEGLVMKCLNEHYSAHGYNLVPGSFFEDCKEKTDCWQLTATGGKLRSAIKARVSKNDILVAMRDPFYGISHKETVVGRDVLFEYFQYITLSQDGGTIRVANGKVIHRICNSLWAEFLEQVGDIDMSAHPYNKARPLRLLKSSVVPGCELWLHYDRWKGQPKILGFIPPTNLKEHKEIKYHKFIED
jgi:hypothetical protein